MKFTNLKTELSNEKILKKLNCTMASPLHDEFLEELLEIKEEAQRMLHPFGAMAFGEISGQVATKEYPERTRVTGIFPSRLTASINSRPSIPGIFISVMRRSTGVSFR